MNADIGRAGRIPVREQSEMNISIADRVS